jgi:hypothetical protein
VRPTPGPFHWSRLRDARVGPRVFLGMMVVGALAVIAYAAFVRSPGSPTTPLHVRLHLPNLGRLTAVPGPCSARAYPPGAKYTFERCTSSTTPVAWSRCSKVTYAVDGSRAPAGSASDVQQAVTQLEAATGLRLVPVSGSADITIAWDPSLYNPRPGTSGEAGETDFQTASGGLSGPRVASASVRLSAHLVAGTAPGIGEKPILLHELGHAVGLGHFTGPEIMNPLDQGFASYQPGDLAGLAALYHPSSCTA